MEGVPEVPSARTRFPPRKSRDSLSESSRCSVGLMLDDELDMIALIERIQDEARMLDENVPGWWRVPDAVDRIVASKLCDPLRRRLVPALPARPMGVADPQTQGRDPATRDRLGLVSDVAP